MNNFDPQAYGPVFAALIETNRRRAIDVGRHDIGPWPVLVDLTIEAAFAHLCSEFEPAQPQDRDMAMCCISAVWLMHDYLEESHKISQMVDTPSGSLWHGMMHRREGDFANAKYWFRRAGRHAVFDPLGQRAAELAAERGEIQSASRIITHGEWDPFAFVDLCESVLDGGRPEVHELCLDLQQAEWEILFDSCYRASLGR
jgi:hypothetical protein